ncbi:hypothetical protein TVAG_121700 [Trichomonas vaginalis G3]|uniref:Coatomer subunit zeta n=1 Tax=Trichomonas vaginalis (strain ATCC PRA-98 / G3) TaxID=412133 RepID=A2E981_TRIV3|nr:vesicle-mediated transport [Trichomonas vaginalis G3]EAY10766.1 hypothetical protein TVAG_121700 [Trichomonas vaginalis G3]KAI5536096.1 vesicle-mediated transport [Trichomonas vaginalis G3]|eukprot:XP_001322989.1 hypothetical protein [Trichomonas vaginalis G3]
MSFQDLTKVKAVFFYSHSGSRITAQYYDNSIPDEKRTDFENNIFKRASEDFDGQIMQHEEYITVYRNCNDVVGFVVGDLKANELLLDEVLETIFTALSLVYKKVSYDDLMKQIDLLYLLLDETIEQGYIFEGDPEIVAARVVLKDDKAFAGKAVRSSQGF